MNISKLEKERDKNNTPARDKGSVTYNATIESAATSDLDQDISDFACRVERETRRRGFDKAERQVIPYDGSLWATGSNSKGQLGEGTTILRRTPIQILF